MLKINPPTILLFLSLIFASLSSGVSVAIAAPPSQSQPGGAPGQDPSMTLQDVQALYPNYDCVWDEIGGYLLPRLPLSGPDEVLRLRTGDVVVFAGADLADQLVIVTPPSVEVRVPAGPLPGLQLHHFRVIGDAAVVQRDGDYAFWAVGMYAVMLPESREDVPPIGAVVPKMYMAVCHPLPPTATPTLPATFTPVPGTNDGWVLIYEFEVSQPGSLVLPSDSDQFFLWVSRDAVQEPGSGETRFYLNNQFTGAGTGSGGSCFTGSGSSSAMLLPVFGGPRVLSWGGWEVEGGNPWCSGNNGMTRTLVRIYAPVGYIGIPPLPYLSPPPNRLFIGAWRGAGPLDMAIPVGSLVRVRLMAGLPLNRDAIVSGQGFYTGGSSCSTSGGSQDFVASSPQLSIRSACRYAYLEFEVWSPEQATVTPTQTFTPSPTWTVTRTPTSTRTPIPTRTPTPTFHVGQCPAYQINGTRDLALHGYWMLFRSSAVVVKAVQINGQAVDLTLPVWGSQDRPLYLNPAGQFARVRLQAVGSTPGVVYFCEVSLPTPTSLLVTRTRTVTATPTGTVTATPTHVVDDFEPVCDWEPCVTVSYAQVLFERLSRDDSFAAPPVSECRSHVSVLLPPAPTRIGFERIVGGPSPMVTADGVCRVIELMGDWRAVMRGVITIALVGIIFIGIALRVGREIGGASSG